jgi:hypothetical protein
MATIVKLKNSVTTTAAPTTLVQGEVAVNVTDKKVWVGNAASGVVQIVGPGSDDVAVADGGTGASSITANSVILGNGTSALSGNLVAPGTTGNVLTSNGTTWTSAAASGGGGQFFGSAATKAIAYNADTIGENVTVTTGNNGLSAGPITISSTFTVTVQTGATWTIV